jgi:hypothetical protein
MGGNALVGFKQCFDLESEECVITGRAIGTCVKLSVVEDDKSSVSSCDPSEELNVSASHNSGSGGGGGEKRNSKASALPSSSNNVDSSPRDTSTKTEVPNAASSIESEAHSPRSSSPVDQQMQLSRSISQRNNDRAEKGEVNSPESEDMSVGHASTSRGNNTSSAVRQGLKPVEVLLITVDQLPRGGLLHLGGIVSAKSVKLFQTDEEEERDAWWDEIRDEIRAHARVLGCMAVVGYTESIAIHDELCVLSAIGTAVNLDMQYMYLSTEEINDDAVIRRLMTSDTPRDSVDDRGTSVPPSAVTTSPPFRRSLSKFRS